MHKNVCVNKTYIHMSSSLRQRGNFPSHVRSILSKWFRNHSENPYPTPEEKTILLSQCKHTITLNQLNSWFVNMRARKNFYANETETEIDDDSHEPDDVIRTLLMWYFTNSHFDILRMYYLAPLQFMESDLLTHTCTMGQLEFCITHIRSTEEKNTELIMWVCTKLCMQLSEENCGVLLRLAQQHNQNAYVVSLKACGINSSDTIDNTHERIECIENT